MSVMPEWFQEQEQEEREAERRAILTELMEGNHD